MLVEGPQVRRTVFADFLLISSANFLAIFGKSYRRQPSWYSKLKVLEIDFLILFSSNSTPSSSISRKLELLACCNVSWPTKSNEGSKQCKLCRKEGLLSEIVTKSFLINVTS